MDSREFTPIGGVASDRVFSIKCRIVSLIIGALLTLASVVAVLLASYYVPVPSTGDLPSPPGALRPPPPPPPIQLFPLSPTPSATSTPTLTGTASTTVKWAGLTTSLRHNSTHVQVELLCRLSGLRSTPNSADSEQPDGWWCGVGFQGRSMAVASDFVVLHVYNATGPVNASLFDMHPFGSNRQRGEATYSRGSTTANVAPLPPVYDDSQDWTVVQLGLEPDGSAVVVRAVRLLATGDSNDFAFSTTLPSVQVITAMGELYPTGQMKFHMDRRNPAIIKFSSL